MKPFFLVLTLWFMLAASAHAEVNVFACEPEWAALASELGGGEVKVFSATTALQDPHHIEARPSLVARLRKADLLVCTGAELEAGWLPVLLRQAGNARVQPGASGYFEASTFVELREQPTRLDRAEGDVHAAGNPHIQTNPRHIARVAAALAQRLVAIDSGHTTYYQKRAADFSRRWQEATVRWERAATPLKGRGVVSQHKSWVYLYEWLGMKEVAVLEPKPGVPPSSTHLAQLLAQLKTQPATMVIHAQYQDPQSAQWLSERAGLPRVALPFTVGANDKAHDLFGLFDDTIAKLNAAGKP